MKILQLTKKVPYPLKDGESIAIHYLSKGLVEVGCQVDLLAINTKKHFVQIKGTPHELEHYNSIKTVYLDNTITLKDAFLNLVTNKSYNIERFISADFSAVLEQELETNSYDVVQLETLYMAPYIDVIKRHSNALISMRSHNLEHEIWENLSVTSKHLAKSKYYKLCAKRLKSYESKIIKDYDILLPISCLDLEKYVDLDFNGSSLVTPVGLELKDYFKEPERLSTSIKLGYIGSLDWKPNLEGIDWFLTNCWQAIRDRFPHMVFHLAGRNMPEKYKNLSQDGLVIKGEVEDARLFMHNLDILVVPLFSGSGIRVKILEAMAMGKAVLSTAKGFEGIPIEDGRHGLFFSDLHSLLENLNRLVGDKELVETIQVQGQKLVTNAFGHKAIAKSVKELYMELIA